MKRQRKIILGIVGIVVAGGAIGLGMFLSTGSEVGVWFILLGVPLLLIAGVAVYVRGVVSRSSTGESEYVRQQARTAGDELREFWIDYTDLQETYPGWDPTELETEVGQVLDDFRAQGIDFDPDEVAYSLPRFSTGDLQELERLEDAVETLDERMRTSFGSFVRGEIDRMERDLDRLDEAGLATPDRWDGPPENDADVEALAAALDDHRTEATETIRRAAETVEDLAREGDDVDEDHVEELLSTATDQAEADDYGASVDAVLDAQAAIEADLSTRYDDLREAVERLLDTAESSVVEEYVAPEKVAAVDDVREETRALDSALDMADLRRLRDDLRETCTAMVREMEEELSDHLETLAEVDVPPNYYDRPAAADRDFVGELRGAGSVEEYRREWIEAIGELSTAIDDLGVKASVAESYPDIAERIDSELRTSGRVTADDLPLRQADDIMELYAREHPDTEFDPEIPELVNPDAGETHTLTVLATFELDTGGREREAEVTVEGPGYEEREHITTYVAEEVEFDVPHGEHTVRVEPSGSDHRPAESTVVVDEDRSVELTMAEVGLREKLCEGVEDEIGGHLSELSPRLAEQFEEEDHLASTMSFPIDDDYVPCLIALWAEDRGHAIAQDDDGTVVVYEGSRAADELDKVVQHNLGEGDEMSFDELRTNFLSAPLPDGAIRDILEDVAADRVDITDTGMRKVSA